MKRVVAAWALLLAVIYVQPLAFLAPKPDIATVAVIAPSMTVSPNPVIRGDDYVLRGTGFRGSRPIKIVFGDGSPTIIVKPQGGTFSLVGHTGPSTPDSFVIEAYDGKALVARLSL